MFPTSETDVDQAITHNAASSITSGYPFTIATWINAFRETPRGVAYLGNGANDNQNAAILGSTYAGSVIYQNSGGGRVQTFSTSSIGGWHHIAVVFESKDKLRIYVDGSLDRLGPSGGGTDVLPFNTSRFSIGALTTSTPESPFRGGIDDVGVWDEALSATRVRLIYGLGAFADVSLDDPSIAAVEAIYAKKSGSATSGKYSWHYATGLPDPDIEPLGHVGTRPFIALGGGANGPGSGNGIIGSPIPEPAGVGALLAAAACSVFSRRRRPRKLRALHGT